MRIQYIYFRAFWKQKNSGELLPAIIGKHPGRFRPAMTQKVSKSEIFTTEITVIRLGWLYQPNM
jgi:hypothetical protein